MATICPQRILQEAMSLLNLLDRDQHLTETEQERLDNNLQELDTLSKALARDNITQIAE